MQHLNFGHVICYYMHLKLVIFAHISMHIRIQNVVIFPLTKFDVHNCTFSNMFCSTSNPDHHHQVKKNICGQGLCVHETHFLHVVCTLYCIVLCCI